MAARVAQEDPGPEAPATFEAQTAGGEFMDPDFDMALLLHGAMNGEGEGTYKAAGELLFDAIFPFWISAFVFCVSCKTEVQGK